MTGARAHRILFCVLIVLMAAAIIFVPRWGWYLHTLLSPNIPENYQKLAAENEALRAQLAQYQIIAEQLPNSLPNYARAMVYSRYPTNFRNELLIGAGSRAGISVGKAVVIEAATSSYVLIGKIKSVSDDTAVVQTVFDPAFKMPVRIGSHGYDGLLIGGVYPKAASILKTVAIQTGDVVASADSALPYGLPIAAVGGVSVSSDNLFQEASLDFAYDINGIQTVLIAR